MADDEIVLPQVPEAKPDDPEDVSWALSTAEAMWARGDHVEGLKWVRKAAEAASEAEDDMRALELAKVAADLAALINRRSLADGDAGSSPTTARSAVNQAPGSGRPPSSNAPRPPAAPPPVPSAAKGRSAPPIPLPSKASAAPAAPSAAPKRGAPRPLAVGAPPAPSEAKRSRRRSRENLDKEARGVLDTAPQRTMDVENAANVLAVAPPAPSSASSARARRRSRPDETTVITDIAELERQRALQAQDAAPPAAPAELRRSAAEWDASPTEDLTSDELGDITYRADRETTIGAPPAHSAPPPEEIPALAAPRIATGSVRPRAATIHDPQLQISQAVRVVVWRDANGVHVAPAGTVVSAITIDAVLVTLEPSADLTAWLGDRER